MQRFSQNVFCWMCISFNASIHYYKANCMYRIFVHSLAIFLVVLFCISCSLFMSHNWLQIGWFITKLRQLKDHNNLTLYHCSQRNVLYWIFINKHKIWILICLSHRFKFHQVVLCQDNTLAVYPPYGYHIALVIADIGNDLIHLITKSCGATVRMPWPCIPNVFHTESSL